MKTASAVILGIALLVMAVPAFASRGRNVDVEVVSDRGTVFQLIPHKRYSIGSTYVFKQYLEAKKGENYNILIRNHLSERIGVVIAVDGRNIITGKKSFLESNEMMYIVEPYGQTRLEGWRTSDDKVNRFYFTSSADSYSVRTFSDTSAMGVIAVPCSAKSRGLQHSMSWRDSSARHRVRLLRRGRLKAPKKMRQAQASALSSTPLS